MSERGTGRERIDADNAERFRGLRTPLGVTSFGLNQMTMLPGQRGRIHRHESQEEVFLVHAGTLTVELEGEGEPLELEAGELIRIAPELKRQLSNRGSETVHLLAIGGYGTHEGRDGIAFTDWGQQRGAPPQEVPLPEDLEV
ncbi:MAG: cupin domain-containing protein [Solirubrobacterales bacterium]